MSNTTPAGDKILSTVTPTQGTAVGADATVQGDVPSPTVLLAIQVGGGLLALLPILTLKQFISLPDTLFRLLVVSALINVVISAIVLIGFLTKSRLMRTVIDRIGEIGICRILIFYDILMLGGLVFLTGGSDKSAFAPQFAAILPMAVLIRDTAAVKWSYATFFLFMYLLGLQADDTFQFLQNGQMIKERWSLVFFFIFTLFPVIYSIQSQRTN